MIRGVIAAVSIGLWCLTACTPLGDIGLGDAGPDAGNEQAGPDTCDDGGPCFNAEDACAELVTACCGETCGESPACAAATLVRDHEPDRCADALQDTQTFPHCALGNCDSLVAKVCGPANECPDAPGCAAAQTLLERNTDPEATQDEIDAASSSCLQALEDEVVFAPCF